MNHDTNEIIRRLVAREWWRSNGPGSYHEAGVSLPDLVALGDRAEWSITGERGPWFGAADDPDTLRWIKRGQTDFCVRVAQAKPEQSPSKSRKGKPSNDPERRGHGLTSAQRTLWDALTAAPITFDDAAKLLDNTSVHTVRQHVYAIRKAGLPIQTHRGVGLWRSDRSK